MNDLRSRNQQPQSQVVHHPVSPGVSPFTGRISVRCFWTNGRKSGNYPSSCAAPRLASVGKMVNVNIHIEEFSTQDDRKALIDAFKRSGQDEIVVALGRMKGKGRFSTPYGVGNEVKYIFELPPDKGRRHIRLITDRRIAFGEAYANTRSKEYSLGGVDLFRRERL